MRKCQTSRKTAFALLVVEIEVEVEVEVDRPSLFLCVELVGGGICNDVPKSTNC